MQIAYICHSISGDPELNLMKIGNIAREINLSEPDTVPFAPYFMDCLHMDDDIPEERARGIANDTELIKRGFIDEMRLYGDRISHGMAEEIKLAFKLGIPIIAMTEGTKRGLSKIEY